MTARKGSFRGRRDATGGVQIPKSIAEWFAGERRVSFFASSPPHLYRLRAYWDAWVAKHPGAVPPEGFEPAARRGEATARLLQRLLQREAD